MGGSDQWGNIVNGTDLIRRVDGKQAFALTTPLITTADGAKMGKTAAGAVWLNEDSLPGFDYWQFWRNTHDADVGRFLKLFTDLPLDEIARLEALEGADINHAKEVLATEATALCRGAGGGRGGGSDGAGDLCRRRRWGRLADFRRGRAGYDHRRPCRPELRLLQGRSASARGGRRRAHRWGSGQRRRRDGSPRRAGIGGQEAPRRHRRRLIPAEL